jgi:DNA modification methylase
MYELFPVIQDETLPTEWNPEESIKKINGLYKQFKKISAEMFHEMWLAHKAYTNPGVHKLVTNVTRFATFEDYCNNLPFTRMTAYRMIQQYEDLRIYNIWKLPKGDSDFFGAFPKPFMRQFLRYHSKENDLIYDPFAGSGTTIDICLDMKRRFYCSDFIPTRDEIKAWDIADGLPNDLPKVDIAFLDPPYWIQAHDQYSNDERDLGNMDLKGFYKVFNTFIKKLIGIERIAILIQGTQYLNENHEFENHMDEFTVILHEKYKTEMIYIIPYSTQQYNAQQVEIMKAENKPLVLHRELKVWRLR